MVVKPFKNVLKQFSLNKQAADKKKKKNLQIKNVEEKIIHLFSFRCHPCYLLAKYGESQRKKNRKH